MGGSATARTFTGTLTDLNNYFNNAGNIQYLHSTPNLTGNNADTIQVVINDNGNTGAGGGANQTLGVINVDITDTNDPPSVASNSPLNVIEGSLGNPLTSSHLSVSDIDDPATSLIYTITDAVDHGSLVLSGTGTLSINDTFTQDDIDSGRVLYHHDGSETTSDSFDFALTDGSANISGVFSITVTLINENSVTPILDIDAAPDSVLEDAVIGTTVGVTAFASDADVGDFVTYSLDDSANGKFSIDAHSGQVMVASALDYEASSSEVVTIRATSTDGSSVVQSISLSIEDVNEAPTASGEAFTVNPGQTLAVTTDGVIFNDVDVDGDTLSLVIVSQPSGGTLTLQPGGLLLYTPFSNFFGQDSFAYRVSDGVLESNVAEATIDVELASTYVPGDAGAGGDDSSPPTSSVSDSGIDPSDGGQEGGAGQDSPSIETTLSQDSTQNTSVTSVITPGSEDPDNDSHQQTPRHVASQRVIAMSGLLNLDAQASQQIMEIYGQSSDLVASRQSHSPELAQLERLLREDLEQAIVWSQWDEMNREQEMDPVLIFVGAASAGAGVFSIGYVMWAIRGTALMTVCASSMPAWRFIDPVAMLTAYRRSKGLGNDRVGGLF